MVDISPDITQKILRIAVALVPILLGMVLHELAHGYAAYKMGDPTAKLQGRLTLNPLKHLDVTGTLVFVITALASPFVFGWAKPVNVQPRYFKDPRKGMMIVSFAGPATNFLLAIAFGGLYSLLVQSAIGTVSVGQPVSDTMQFFLRMALAGIWINFTLGWFNLLPIPSLDGGHILAGFLPVELARKFYSLGRYALIIIVALFATKAFSAIMRPLVGTSVDLLGTLFSIPSQLL